MAAFDPLRTFTEQASLETGGRKGAVLTGFVFLLGLLVVFVGPVFFLATSWRGRVRRRLARKRVSQEFE